MVGKRGFLRVFEAIIGIIIVFGFLIFLIQRQQPNVEEFGSDGKIILDEISKNEIFREEVLNGEISDELRDFVKGRINNPSLEYALRICQLEEVCSFDGEFLGGSELYVAERVFSTNLRSQEFSPKKLKLFIWRIG